MNEKKRPRIYQKHGTYRLKKAVKELGSRAVDKRTVVGKALHEWRQSLLADLGGGDAISTQQAALLDLAVKQKLILDSIDAWLLTRKTLVVQKGRHAARLLPVVKERQQLADGLARYLAMLGLERVRPPAVDLSTYTTKKYGADSKEQPR